EKISTGKFHVEPPLLHSITSSARASSVGGTVRPSANPVGACLGADRTEHIRTSLKRLETGSNILHTPNLHRDHGKAGRAGRCLNRTHVPPGDEIAGIAQNR